jgi:hypothetical protein
MSRAILYPYPTAADTLELSCSGIGRDLEWQGNAILLDDLGPNENAQLSLTVTLDSGIDELVFPEAERHEPPRRVTIAVRSTSSRFRTALELERNEDGQSWTCNFEITRRKFHGALQLEPIVVRTSDGSDPEYAHHRGARLAWGAPVDIRLEPTPPREGDYLDMEFENFEESGNALRRRNRNLLFALDLERDPPKLWLNNGITRFEMIMKSRARRGIPARIRNATYDTICVQVWTSLISMSTTTLAATVAADPDAEDALEQLSEWQQRVINFWAPRLFPESTREEAVDQFVHAASRIDRVGALQDRTAFAVQAWAKSAEAFRGLVRFVEGENL